MSYAPTIAVHSGCRLRGGGVSRYRYRHLIEQTYSISNICTGEMGSKPTPKVYVVLSWQRVQTLVALKTFFSDRTKVLQYIYIYIYIKIIKQHEDGSPRQTEPRALNTAGLDWAIRTRATKTVRVNPIIPERAGTNTATTSSPPRRSKDTIALSKYPIYYWTSLPPSDTARKPIPLINCNQPTDVLSTYLVGCYYCYGVAL